MPVAVAVIIAMAVGVVVGLVAASTWRRSARSATVAQAATPSAGAARDRRRDRVADVLAEAVNHLEIGVVIADADGTEVYRNDAATVRRGTHEGVIVDDHLERLLRRARNGERATALVELHGPPQLALALVAEAVPGGAAVATLQDVSERRRIDAMRTDFVANISHELKTPVGAIAVLADALVDERDPAVVARVAERMVDEAHRAARTIDDLLELSRIESARTGREVVELDAIVQAAIARGRIADRGRGIRVEAIDADAPIRLLADGRQLVSAIGNLVENAVKYSHDKGSVEVRTRVADDFVEVTVADQGVGIPARDLDRIFERFYRVDKARSRHTGGTGLGLAIVRHVATNHGGEVAVSSHEGEGSTFAFRLPASLVVSGRTVASDDAGHDASPNVEPRREESSA